VYRLTSGCVQIKQLKAVLVLLSAATFLLALSALVGHSLAIHYRDGEIGRLTFHHALISKVNDRAKDDTRRAVRMPPSALLVVATPSPLILGKFELWPPISLHRLLLRLRIGLRSHADDNPAIF
jgi:hypothetical protein